MGDLDEVLDRVVARRVERESLGRKRASLAAELMAADRRAHDLRLLLADEERDVDKLESLSPTRIMAALRGERATDLERQTAERDAARYRAAEAQARADTLRRDLAGLDARLAEFWSLDDEYRAVLDAKERWLSTQPGPQRDQLGDLVERRAELKARDARLGEAHEASVVATQWLRAAEAEFARAKAWSTWDSFGGGSISGMLKNNSLDKATATLRNANLLLGALAREVAEVGVHAVGSVEVDGLGRGLDVWFDDLFSDLSVHSRIVEAHQRVRAAEGAVDAITQRVEEEHAAIGRELAVLATTRERLLTGPDTP